ncbi:lipoprotein [Spiroplasma ixodetis]|uniref:lipoprotein n=1 Tax=Spiroplasma ixodetis TaxID=2141 RepID=UPI002575623F|nr:lipoprotein [Spiroplasma ixodetis]WJG70033.1 hypothetical protein SIXOD_v1c10630 [Spiroplasma ixodetis Y32]
MRKILSLLGATILSTTASASITACDNGDRPSTQKIDLNDVPSKVELTGVSKNIKSDFCIKLINKIKELKQEFSKLEKTDIDITKVDGSTLQDSDIDNNPKLEIKISTFPNNKNFMGSKDIEVNLTVTKTNLSFLPDNLEIQNVRINDLKSFKTQLGAKIERQPGFGNFGMHNVDIFKNTSIPLEDSDIVNKSDLQITITTKTTSQSFMGSKNIKVNLTVY